MSENAGLYQKFDVKRRDGRDASGGDREGAIYLTFDIVHDEFALDAIRGCRIACEGRLPEFSKALFALEQEMIAGNREGPMHQALRTPK